jgi:hypothetical protein
MFFTGLISLLGSSAVGSILGGIFGWLNRKSDMEMKRLEFEHERAKWANDSLMRDKDIAYAKVEAEGRKDVAVAEAEGVATAAQMTAIAEAQKADQITAEDIKAAGAWGWLVALALALNKFVRPVLTVILCYSAIKVNWMVIEFFTNGWTTMTESQQYDAGMQAFAWVTGQASAVIGYWFVSRGRIQ